MLSHTRNMQRVINENETYMTLRFAINAMPSYGIKRYASDADEMHTEADGTAAAVRQRGSSYEPRLRQNYVVTIVQNSN